MRAIPATSDCTTAVIFSAFVVSGGRCGPLLLFARRHPLGAAGVFPGLPWAFLSLWGKVLPPFRACQAIPIN